MEKEQARLQLIKAKKKQAICSLVMSLLLVASLVVFVAALNCNETFLIVGIVQFTILFIICFLIEILYITPKNKSIKSLVIAFAGNVSVADIAIAKSFSTQWKTYSKDIESWNFDFMGEQDYENFKETISNILGRVALGVKSEKDSFYETIKNDFVSLIAKKELDEKTKSIINLLFEIIELVERNSYTLTQSGKISESEK